VKIRIVSLVVFAVLLAACGASASLPAAPTSAPAAVVPTSAPATAVPVLAPTSAPSSPQVVEATNEYRLIRHATGEAQVPLNPKCIVVAGSGYLDHLLTLDVKPCGAAHGPGGSGFPDYLAGRLEGVKYVGGTLEVNLETVALLDPDLIFAMHPAHTSGEFATNFDPIAPTVYLNEPWADWRKTLEEMGLILGKQEHAKAKLAEFDSLLASAKTRLGEVAGAEKVLFLRVLPQEIRIYGSASPTGDILYNGLGLTPSAATPSGEPVRSISLELIPELDADHIFLLDQTEDSMATIKASPLWQKIPAVQQGNIYPVDVKIWVQGEGMIAYTQLMKEAVAALVGE
jgi:iron complex transport system substrate-binding protein